LILDLGQKHMFWHLLGHFNLDSPMSMGVWLLMVFGVISGVFILFWIPDEWRNRIPAIGKWRGWSNRLLRKRFGRMGLPFAVAVIIYSAVLLSVTAVPLWRNYMLPLVFFFSAIAMGLSVGLLLSILLPLKDYHRDFSRPLEFSHQVLLIIRVALLMSIIAFVVLAAGNLEGRSALGKLFSGWMGVLWWGGAIGMGVILPLFLGVSKKRWSNLRAGAIFAMVLIGGLVLRWVVVVAGQS